MNRRIERVGVLAGIGLSITLSLVGAASAQHGGSAPPAGRTGGTKTNGDFQQILNQMQNGIIGQEKSGSDQANGLFDISRLMNNTVIWQDDEATSLSPPSTPPSSNIAAEAAAASAAAFKAMDQINQADLDNAQNANIDVDNFVGGSADDGDDADAEYAAMQSLVTEASTAVSNGEIDPDLAGAEDLSAGVQSAALAAIYAGYNLDANGLTVTSLDYYPPYPSDVMISLDLQPALCGR